MPGSETKKEQKVMSKNELVTAFTLGGLYHCLCGDDTTADFCWRTALEILEMTFPLVGEA